LSAGASASSGCRPGAAAGLTVCSDHEGLLRTKGSEELHDRILFPLIVSCGPHITLVAVICRLILHSALIGDLLPYRHQLVPQNLNVFDGLEETMSKRENKTEVEL